MENMKKARKTWHQFTDSKDPKFLEALLADDVVFYSPVVHKPQERKGITTAYLIAAMMTLGDEKSNFTYTKEVMNERDIILEFTAEIDGVLINGVDMMQLDQHGKVAIFKVMIRPLKAVNMIHQKMGEILQKMQS